MSIIDLFLLVLILICCFCCLLALYSVFRVLRYSESKIPNPQEFPPVSILKPLSGVDPGLKSNLSAFCQLDYPDYELIFCLENDNDPALDVVKELKQKCPRITIKVEIDNLRYGYNPKVNNLIRGLDQASYDSILISDADVCPDKAYLKDLAPFLQDNSVGMVTNLICGRGNNSLGAILENLNLNFFVLGGTCFLYHFFHYTCVTGKSILLRKKDLDMVGGLLSVKNYLAEDQILEKKFMRFGKKIMLSNHLITSNNHKRNLKKFFTRNLRWSQLRMQLGGLGYLSEFLLNPVFFSLIFSIVSSLSTFSLALLLGTSLFKIILESIQGKLILDKASFLIYLFAPLKDLLIGILFFFPFFKTKVNWRGMKFKLKRYTELEPL